jgi:hypothetical protein
MLSIPQLLFEFSATLNTPEVFFLITPIHSNRFFDTRKIQVESSPVPIWFSGLSFA